MTQSIHIMLCYFNGFDYRLSFCSQGQHLDIFMDNVDMVYMNIMICWNIIMVMCIYFGPAIDVCRRPIFSKPWPYNLYICQTKQSIQTYCLLFVYFFILPRIVLDNIIKHVNIKFSVRTTRFWNNIHHLSSKPKYLKVKQFKGV